MIAVLYQFSSKIHIFRLILFFAANFCFNRRYPTIFIKRAIFSIFHSFKLNIITSFSQVWLALHNTPTWSLTTTKEGFHLSEDLLMISSFGLTARRFGTDWWML
ncbi:hypothetical protein ACJX0J_018093 [Zea mays]